MVRLLVVDGIYKGLIFLVLLFEYAQKGKMRQIVATYLCHRAKPSKTRTDAYAACRRCLLIVGCPVCCVLCLLALNWGDV
jgi:hypothetical protein